MHHLYENIHSTLDGQNDFVSSIDFIKLLQRENSLE